MKHALVDKLDWHEQMLSTLLVHKVDNSCSQNRYQMFVKHTLIVHKLDKKCSQSIYQSFPSHICIVDKAYKSSQKRKSYI